MNILIVTVGLPYPLSHGAHLRLYNLMAEMSRDHNLYLLSLDNGASSINDCVHLNDMVKDVYFEKVIEKGTGFFMRQLKVGGCRKLVRERIKYLVTYCGIDVIHYHYPESADYGLVPGLYGVPQVLDYVDSLVLMYRRNAAMATDKGLLWLFRHYFNTIRVNYFERKLVNSADISIVVSPVDAECLRYGAKQTRVQVIPNGVDLNYFAPQPRQKTGWGGVKKIVFVGNMDFSPNIHAVQYFTKNVFPLVRRQLDSVSFTIVGKNPVSSVRALESQQGVYVLGFVDDVRDSYAMADVVVIPMVSGGGIKNKVLEAFAMGKPVVATSLGMEAIDAISGEEAIIADTPEEMAAAINVIVTSERLAEHLGNSARELIKSKYSWTIAASSFCTIYQKLTIR